MYERVFPFMEFNTQGADAGVITPVGVIVLDCAMVSVGVRVPVRVMLAVRVTTGVCVRVAGRVTVAMGVVTTPLQVSGDHNPRCAVLAARCASRKSVW